MGRKEAREAREAQQREQWKAQQEAKEALLKTQEEAKQQKEQIQQQMLPYYNPDFVYSKLITYLEKAEEHLKQALDAKEKHSDLEWAQAYAGLVAAHASLAISAELHTVIPGSRLAAIGSLLR